MKPLEKVSRLLARIGGEHLGARLIRGVSGVALVKVLGALLGFAGHIVLARVMSVDDYGIYIYVWGWVVILGFLSRAGFDNVLVRFVAQFNAEQKWPDLRGLLRRSTQIVAASSALVVTITLGVLWALGDQMGADRRHTFYAALVLVPILSLTLIRQSTLRGLKLVVRANTPELLIRHVGLITMAGGLWLALGQLQAWQAMSATVGAYLIAFALASWWVWRALPERVAAHAPVYPETGWLKRALPFLVISGTGLIQSQTDVVMLGALSSAADVGIYGATLRLTTLIAFGLTVINMTVTPYFSDLYTRDEHDKLQRLVGIASVGVTVFTVVVSAVLLLFGTELLGLFGEDFTAGYSVMAILVVGRIFGAVTGPVAFLMMMTDQERAASRIEAIAAGANIILNAGLIWQMGALGAAIATATTLTFRNLAFAYVVKRRLGINATIFNLRLLDYLRPDATR